MRMSDYDVQIAQSRVEGWPGPVIHLRIRKRSGRGGITWQALQWIKDQIEPEATAIEVYPPSHEVVDEANMRHLWIVPYDVPMPSLLRRA